MIRSSTLILLAALLVSVTPHQHGEKQSEVEHMKSHLDGVLDFEKLSRMTPEQQKFHLFTMYDGNKDGKLDGLEVLKGLDHMYEHSGGPKLTENDLEKQVDTLLLKSDEDDDGFIDYAEFNKNNEL